MSATLYWRRLSPPRGKVLHGQSSFLEMLARAFDKDRSESKVDIPANSGDKLRAMAFALKARDRIEYSEWSQDLDELAEASDAGDTIRVWAEY